MNNKTPGHFNQPHKHKGIIWVLLLVCLFFLISPFLPVDLLGRCRTLDLARDRKDHFYENGELIYTQNSTDRYIDFVIFEDEDYIHFIPIKKIHTFAGDKYKIGLTTKILNLSEEIIRDTTTYESGEIPWDEVRELETALLMQESSLTEKIFCCVLPPTCMIDEPDVVAHPFEYRDKQYILYVKIEPNNQ